MFKFHKIEIIEIAYFLIMVMFITYALYSYNYQEISSIDYQYLSYYNESQIKIEIQKALKDNTITNNEFQKIKVLHIKLHEQSIKVDSIKTLLQKN